MNIIIFGPPGAGKGTQSSYIVSKYNLKQLSTGDLLRKEIANKTELGKKISEIINGGNLVSDSIVATLVENIKINAVLLNGMNASTKDFNAWSDFIKKNKVNFRYIELMQTGDNLDYFNKRELSLPCGWWVSEEEINLIAKLVLKFAKSCKA